MTYLGDYAEDYPTLNFKFTTRDVQGAGSPPFALASGVISVYSGNSTTQSTAGIVLTTPFDSVVGLNHVLIDLSADAFYAVGTDYQVVITTGTVNSISVVGEVVAHFSIENRLISLAAINAEMDTALRTTADGEPGQETPGVSISIKEKISYLYKAWRNRTTATVNDYALFNGQIPMGQEAHGVRGEPIYAEDAGLDPATRLGHFQLAPGSPGVSAGQAIPNFSDGYTGKAPDIGAHQRGAPPIRYGVEATQR